MDRNKIKATRVLLASILEKHQKELKQMGISVGFGNAKFSDVEATLQVKIVDLTSKGTAVNVYAIDWDKHCASYGLKRAWLGKEISMGNRVFRITGLNIKKRVKPVVVIDVANNKEYITTVETVALRLK